METILFILSGQVFRINHFDNEEIIKRQIVATLSHLDLINTIKDKFNYSVKILFNISNNNNNYIIYNILKNYILKVNEYIKVESEFVLIYETLNLLKNIDLKEENIKYIFFLRPDLYLKKYFICNFKLNNEKIIYTHIDANYKNFDFKHFPSVCHGIVLIPEIFFNLIVGSWHYHGSADNFMKVINDNNKIDFFDNRLYYTTSEYNWNPMYIIIDRPIFNNISLKITTFTRKNNTEIEFYEIDNDENIQQKKEEENFEEIKNLVEITDFLKV
jgi:hypothetical protein